jgi:CDP-diacylglycerol--serine O-phosphatidyltransferase
LQGQHQAEWAALRQHATRLSDYRALESPGQYPEAVRKQLKRLNRTRLDRLLNRLL